VDSYRKKLLGASAQNQWLFLPSYTSEQGNLQRLSFLSRHLGQLIGMQPGPLQNHLLLQFLGEMRGDPKERLFFTPLARLFRERGQKDLLQRLSKLQSDEAFHSHELLIDAEEALTRGEKRVGRLSLEAALTQIERIPKPSHKTQATLLAQEIARRLGDKELLMRLEQQLTNQLPTVSIRLLQNDLKIRLAGLRALCGNQAGYQDLVTDLQQNKPVDSSELILSGDLLERLAAEQVRIGRTEDAWISIQLVPIALIQASALLKTAEQLLQPPPLPSSPPLPSLQNSTGRGLSLLGPR
jgi:hypothetical protein